MSHRNTKMMMLLAQKNMALREKFKESKQLHRNIQTIDPDFFPNSDSDDDLPFSRCDSANQSLAPITHSSNYFESEDLNFLQGSSASNVEYFNQHQDDQNTETGNNNISMNSLMTLTTVPIIEQNDLTEISSPVFCSNKKNVFNLDNASTETLITQTVNDQQTSFISEVDTNQIMITVSKNTLFTSATLTNDSNVTRAEDEKSVEDSSRGNEVLCANLRDTENLAQNEITDDNTHDLTTYTKAGTIRKRKKYDQPLKVRKEAKNNEIREKHGVKPPCPASCKKLCIQNISEDQRKIINESFWNLSDKERKAYMLHHTSVKSVKQRTVIRPESGD